VIWRLDDNFVRADRFHAVKNSLCRARGLAFDAVERAEMRVNTNLPLPLTRQIEKRPRLDAIFTAQGARVGTYFLPFGVAYDDPTASDRILTKFHQ
jgi:hypothetical protein